MPTLEAIYDYYQAVVYDRNMLADSFERLLDRLGAVHVLDCACGTGLPGLDLRARGLEIDCSDADALMLEQFRINAGEREISDLSWLLRWDELESLGRKYDMVMCRGNSLAYAESWEEWSSTAASISKIAGHIRDIAKVLVPGGVLLVDAPRTLTLAEATYPPTTFRGTEVTVSETVTVRDAHRVWEQRVCIGGEAATFVRRSSNLTSAILVDILMDTGFELVEPVAIAGERPSYEVLIARGTNR